MIDELVLGEYAYRYAVGYVPRLSRMIYKEIEYVGMEEQHNDVVSKIDSVDGLTAFMSAGKQRENDNKEATSS